jgi:hypothetical protein
MMDMHPVIPKSTTDRIAAAAPLLGNVRALAAEMVEHFKKNVAPCHSLPHDALHGDVTAVTVDCLRIAATVLDGRGNPTTREVRQLERAAASWAREGIPIDVILGALHEGSRMAHELVATRSRIDNVDEWVEIGSRTVDLLTLMTTTVAMAYLREYRAVAGEHHHAAHTLTSALLSGRVTASMARECGITIAESYRILVIALPRYPAEPGDSSNQIIADRRKLRRLQSELATQCEDRALSLLSIDGGTILIPADSITGERLDNMVHRLSRAAGVAITAVHSEVPRESISAMVEPLHEMLDVAIKLHHALGTSNESALYHFDELTIEYQLSRPGPARDMLAAKVAILREHPELLSTLRTYLASGQSRQRTARRMHVHPNTVDYRLKRIGVLTGLDPAQAGTRWRLRAALIAQSTSPYDATEQGAPA